MGRLVLLIYHPSISPGLQNRDTKLRRGEKRLREILSVNSGNNKIEDFALMGIWDHFYTNSTFDENTSTHYVNLPHFACFKNIPLIVLDDQHVDFDWFDLQLVSTDERFHPYIKNYAEWLIKKLEEIHD